MWRSVQRLGFGGGDVLEPGCGAGTFTGLAPDTARMTGELDPVTVGSRPRSTRGRPSGPIRLRSSGSRPTSICSAAADRCRLGCASPACPRSPRRPASWMPARARHPARVRSGGAGRGELHLGSVVAAFVDVADRRVVGAGLADGELAGTVDVVEAIEVGR